MARTIISEIRALPVQNVPNIRKIRKKYSRLLQDADPGYMFELAREIFHSYENRWISFSLIRYHPAAFRKIGEAELKEFCKGISTWGHVDVFAGFLAGPAWQQGQISDELITEWAQSRDRWLRRTALVCTVVLNRRSCGGTGDVPRTLEVCRLLNEDKDDMVVKAMSWALRELIVHDAKAVRKFLLDPYLYCRLSRCLYLKKIENFQPQII